MKGFNHEDFYLLRMPALPMEGLLRFNNSLVEDPNASFEDSIKAIFSDSKLQEAIYIASPEFYREFMKWLSGEEKNEKNIQKICSTLYKYYIRMSSRSTPYGLFAGCSVGTWGEKTQIEIDEKATKYARLDMNYVAEIAEFLRNYEEIKYQVKYSINHTLYVVGNRYRYTEFKLNNKHRRYFLTSVGRNKYLDQVIEFTKTAKEVSIQQLIEFLTKQGIKADEAENYIHQLIDSQILWSNLEPTLTGEEFFKVLIHKLSELQGTKSIIAVLSEIDSLLKIQDDSIEKYEKIKELINQNFKKTSSKDLIQTDLYFKTPHNTISKNVIQTINSQIQKLSPFVQKYANPYLESFKKSFYERFEEKEVPLLWALDNEIGIGYGSTNTAKSDNLPLVNDVWLPKRPSTKQNIELSKADQWKIEKFYEAKHKNLNEITIDDTVLNELDKTNENAKMSEAFYAFGTLLGESETTIDEGQFQFFMDCISGPSGVSLLGRFCHGSAELNEKVMQAIQNEEKHNPNKIYAEIVHLPEARAGNILLRPQLRRYEIPFLCKSSVDEDFQIPLDDLMVSVPYGERIRLRSKRLNKEIIPRLSSAHNFNVGLAIYRFLGDLQTQGSTPSFIWEWGSMLKDEVFYPRVVYKNLILSKAKWKIRLHNEPQLDKKDLDVFDSYRKLQEKHKIPRLAFLVEGDNQLLIDFDFRPSLEILHQKLQKRGNATLVECVFDTKNGFIKSNNSFFSNELVIPMTYVVDENKIAQPLSQKPESQSLKRAYTLGSEWLYLKIYTGTKTADQILCTHLKPLIEALEHEKIIKKWFFIRYKDGGGEHLRVRFFNDSLPLFWQKVLERIHLRLDLMIQSGLIYNIQTDTYKPEIERYGFRTTELCETMFHADSEAVVNFLDLIEGDEGERYRWLLAARGVDFLLNDFSLTLENKQKFCSFQFDNFFNEFNGTPNFNVFLNDKYRSHSKMLESFMNSENDSTNEIEAAIDIFENRSQKIRSIIDEIRNIQKTFSDAPSLEYILPSIVHMFVNRMFISNQRLHEMLIYQMLMKYYTTLGFKEKQKAKQKIEI